MTESHLNQFLAACAGRVGTDVTRELRDATQRFLAAAANDPALLRSAADSLRKLPPAGAAWMAITLGTSVEEGREVTLTGPALLDYFRDLLQLFPAARDDDASEAAPGPTADQTALIRVFDEICQAVVAHLARMPERRVALAGEQSLIDRLEELAEFGWGSTWVREAILKTSGTLLALQPRSGEGVRLKYANVSNCFHLFSLMQSAVGQRITGGQVAEPKVTAAARGETDEAVSDVAWWHYGDPRSAEPELSTSIWGEGHVRDIPQMHGVQTVLLWPPLLKSRGWDSGFFKPHLHALPADLTVESVLSRDESRALLERLGLKRSSKWWRFW